MPPEVQAKLKSHPNARHYLIYSNIQGIKGILASAIYIVIYPPLYDQG